MVASEFPAWWPAKNGQKRLWSSLLSGTSFRTVTHHQEVRHLLRQFSHFRLVLLCLCCFWSKSWVLFCGIAFKGPVRCWRAAGWMLCPWINLGLERGILARDGSVSLVRLNREGSAQPSSSSGFSLPVPLLFLSSKQIFFYGGESKNSQEWETPQGRKSFYLLFWDNV